MANSTPEYTTRLEQWKRELSAELERDVTYEEIARETGLAYSTLQKHVSHQYKRPDYATAFKICAFFNDLSEEKVRTPQDYFIQAEMKQKEAESPEVAGEAAA